MDHVSKELEALLRNPFFERYGEDVLKTRRNLLGVSALLIFVSHYDLKIGESTFLGTKVNNLSNEVVLTALFLVCCYLLLSFVWLSLEHFGTWRVRLTGSKVAHVTTGKFAHEGLDYPDDPSNSTLFHWWADQARKIGSFRKLADDALTHMAEMRAFVASGIDPNSPTNAGNISRSVHQLEQTLGKITRKLEETEKVLEARRVPMSLDRFEHAYWFIFKAQNARFLILDFGLPTILGIVALALSAKSVSLA